MYYDSELEMFIDEFLSNKYKNEKFPINSKDPRILNVIFKLMTNDRNKEKTTFSQNLHPWMRKLSNFNHYISATFYVY